jgi:hypothetical protein
MYFNYEAEQYSIHHLDELTNTARCDITWTKSFAWERSVFEFKIESVLNFCKAKLLD